MSQISELIDVHPAGEEDHGFEFTCGCGKLSVDDGGGELTAYGGAAAWSHFLQRIALVENIAARFPLPRTSPNATPVRDVLHAFMFNCLLGGKRFSHARRMQDDGWWHGFWAWKRAFLRRDAFPRLISRLEPAQLRTWMSWTERTFMRRCRMPSSRIGTRRSTPVTGGRRTWRWATIRISRGGQPSSAALRGGGHAVGPAHGMAARGHGERDGMAEAMERIWSHPSVRHGLKLNRGDIGFAQEKIMAWHEEKGKSARSISSSSS